MDTKEPTNLSIFFRIAAITSPFWLPLLIGNAFGVFSRNFERISGEISEASVAISGIVAIIIGFVAVVTLPTKGRLPKILLMTVYLIVTPVVLFFSGWGGLFASGYGH